MFRGFLGAAAPQSGTEPGAVVYPTFRGPSPTGGAAVPPTEHTPLALRPVGGVTERGWAQGQPSNQQQDLQGPLQVHRQQMVEHVAQASASDPYGQQALLRHEMQQQLAASVPAPVWNGAKGPAPVQFIIQNTATSNTEQKTVNAAPPMEPAPAPKPPETLRE